MKVPSIAIAISVVSTVPTVLVGGCDAGADAEAPPPAAEPATGEKSESPELAPPRPEVTLQQVRPAGPELERAASAWAPTIRACYATALREDAASAGSVDVAVRSAEAGGTEVTTPGLPESVRQCVADAARTWDFAAFGATGDVQVHFTARPRPL